MPNRVNRLIRSRLVWPVALVFAALTIMMSEAAYRVAKTSASQAVEINAARWSINRLQLAAAELDLSYRGVVLTGDAAFRERYRAALSAMSKELDGLKERYVTRDAQAKALFEKLRQVYAARIAEMDKVIQVRDAGEVERANALLHDEVARRLVEDAEPVARGLLQREARLLREERDSFFAALVRGRSGVILMTLAALVGIGAFRHVSLRLHRQGEEQRLALERERERLETAVTQRTTELRTLARHLQTAVEDERAGLARELHDELGALLTAAKLDVARLKSRLPPSPDLESRVAHLNEMLNDGIALKRRIIEDLRPSALNNLGLLPALEILAREYGERMGIPIELKLEPVQTTPATALTIYRFVQEAVTNAAKHARAAEVKVSLVQSGGQTRIEVQDDGVGFDADRVTVGHHGLSGMRFRVESLGGEMSVRSEAGHTVLAATMPMSASLA